MMRSSAIRFVYGALFIMAVIKQVQGQYTLDDGTILDGTYTSFNLSKPYGFPRKNPKTIVYTNSKIVCPSSLDFKADSQWVDFPDGIKDTTGTCLPNKPKSEFNSRYLLTYGKQLPYHIFLGKSPPTYMKYYRLLRHLDVPNGTIVCPGLKNVDR